MTENIIIDGAQIWARNFSGKEGKLNRDRSSRLLLTTTTFLPKSTELERTTRRFYLMKRMLAILIGRKSRMSELLFVPITGK